MLSGVGYRLTVPRHRSVQLLYLEVGVLDEVWLRLTVVSGSSWVLVLGLVDMLVSGAGLVIGRAVSGAETFIG